VDHTNKRQPASHCSDYSSQPISPKGINARTLFLLLGFALLIAIPGLDSIHPDIKQKPISYGQKELNRNRFSEQSLHQPRRIEQRKNRNSLLRKSPGKVEHNTSSGNESITDRYYQEPMSPESIIELANNVRASHGLNALHTNPLLNAIAEARARDMVEKNYFAHMSPSGELASDIAARVGYRYRIMFENIAAGGFRTNRNILKAWVDSPNHRKRIFSHYVNETGVSVIKGKVNGSIMWVAVQVFGLPVTESAGKLPDSPQEHPWEELGARFAALDSQHQRLSGTKAELEFDRKMIERSSRVCSNDPDMSWRINQKIKAYNRKAEQFNRSLAEMNTMKTALNSVVDDDGELPARYATDR
jgi:uncharacterized protein YkwD